MAERLDQRREQAAWLYVIIVLVIVFALSELISRYYFSDPQPDDKAGYPLFVMTRWTNPLKSIPIDKLNLAYCAGRVSVMFSSKSLADRMFSCKNKTVIKDNAGLLRVSATHLIVGDIDSLSPRYKAISVSGKDYFTMPKDYPLVNSPRRNHDTIAKSLTRISITGVTAITRATGIIADRHGPNYLIQKVKRQFKDSHYVHISNEVSVIPNHSYGGGLKFATKPEHLAVIKKLNPNIFVELTGNHIRDFGNGPLLNTLKWYRDNNIPYFGGGKNPVEAAKPLILKLKDKSTLAFIGFNTNCILGECSKSRNQPGANP
ncbi:MAG: CapA family protein, partial [Spirochaetota bacterium]|nr:CapA family protein [Spirochaetota bacterium]